jgi:hypothetical protein
MKLLGSEWRAFQRFPHCKLDSARPAMVRSKLPVFLNAPQYNYLPIYVLANALRSAEITAAWPLALPIINLNSIARPRSSYNGPS